MCTKGWGGQEPHALTGAPLCTTDQLYQPGVLNRSPRALWGTWVWRQEPPMYPGWGLSSQHPHPPLPPRAALYPPALDPQCPTSTRGNSPCC